MKFMDGLNYQNYHTIEKTKETTDLLVKANEKLEEVYESNEYELGIFKKSKTWLQYVNRKYLFL